MLNLPPIIMQRDEVTLQVNRRVQIFLVSGFMTPHCLLRSNSFPGRGGGRGSNESQVHLGEEPRKNLVSSCQGPKKQ